MYVSFYDSNVIKYFSQVGHKQPVLGQITTGLDEPEGLYVVPSGDLYVANGSGGTVPVYHKGSQTPYEELTGFGLGASDVTVDESGTVFVATGSTIHLFAGGSKTPTSELHIARPKFAVNVATDSKGDLFVQTETDADNGARVEMFPAGSKKSIQLPMTTDSAGGLAVDRRDDLVVCDDGLDDGYQGGIYVYAPPYMGGPIEQNDLLGGTTGCAASKKRDRVWATEEGNYDAAAEYTPELHLTDLVFFGGGFAEGIGVDP